MCPQERVFLEGRLIGIVRINRGRYSPPILEIRLPILPAIEIDIIGQDCLS